MDITSVGQVLLCILRASRPNLHNKSETTSMVFRLYRSDIFFVIIQKNRNLVADSILS